MSKHEDDLSNILLHDNSKQGINATIGYKKEDKIRQACITHLIPHHENGGLVVF
jgi:hypothetical protein